MTLITSRSNLLRKFAERCVLEGKWLRFSLCGWVLTVHFRVSLRAFIPFQLQSVPNQSPSIFIEVTNFQPNPSGNKSVLFEIILHIFSIIAGFKSNFIPTIEIFEAIRTSKWISDVGWYVFVIFSLDLYSWRPGFLPLQTINPNSQSSEFRLIQNGENLRGFRCAPVVWFVVSCTQTKE